MFSLTHSQSVTGLSAVNFGLHLEFLLTGYDAHPLTLLTTTSQLRSTSNFLADPFQQIDFIQFTTGMPARTTQNPSALIGNVLVLEGNLVGFLAWHTRIEDLFAIQGVHNIVTAKLL
jgi:hypothetical protein